MTWTKLAVIGLAIVSLLIIWQTHQIWSAAFLGVLFALSLNGPAEWIRPYIHMPRWLATSLVMLVVLLTLSGLGWIIGSPMSTQFDEVSKALPAAAQKVSVWLDQHPLGKSILKRVEVVSGRSNSSPQTDDATEVHSFGFVPDGIPDDQLQDDGQAVTHQSAQDEPPKDEEGAKNDEPLSETAAEMPHVAELFGHIAGALAITVKTVMLLLLSLVVMLFVAFDPQVYQRGVIWLVPKQQESNVRQTMDRLCVAMRWWVAGRLASMAAVGMLTTLGMWMIGMPAPLALGAIAGLLSFVPNLGPIMGALPGLLLASAHSPSMILWAGGIYLLAQLVESNAITPLVEQYAIAIPPGVLIVTQFIFAALGGVWGMIISTPLLVVVMVLVQQLYVNQSLHKHIEVTGSK